MNDTPSSERREFNTTRWSLVQAVHEGTETAAREALETLCRAYWYPLYVFARSRGHSPPDAQDLTQAFFAQLLETGGFAGADRDRGRFRSWLLGAMKHFLANEWHRAKTLKRGGEVAFLEWDALDPEARYALEPAHAGDPETLFDREWALASIQSALENLRAEMELAGKGEIFALLQGSLTGEESSRPDLAARLGLSEGALKVTIHRLRQRYRELLRDGISQTLADPSEIDTEMRHLVAVLRRRG